MSPFATAKRLFLYRMRILFWPCLLEVLSSHPSIVSAAVVTGAEGPLGPPAVRVRCLQRGCASLWVSLLNSHAATDNQEPFYTLRVCGETPDGLLLPPPSAVLPGAVLPLVESGRVPPSFLPQRAFLSFQLAFQAAPLLEALSAWRGASSADADTAAALLRRLYTPLRVATRRFISEALLPDEGSPQDENSLLPLSVDVRSLRLQPNPSVGATIPSRKREGPAALCGASTSVWAQNEMLLVADLRILNLPSTAAAAIVREEERKKLATAAPRQVAATLDALPCEWRLDGVLLLLQELWRSFAKKWEESHSTATCLLRTNPSASKEGRHNICPSWGFPLAAFLSWSYGFGNLAIGSSSSKSCSGWGALRSSDPSALTVVGMGSCSGGQSGPVVAFAAKPAAEHWVAVEDLSLPACVEGSAASSLTISFRAQTLVAGLQQESAGGHQVEQQQQEWQEMTFVSATFNSHVSVHCRLSDPALSVLFSVEPLSFPSRFSAPDASLLPSVTPICAVRPRERVSLQEVLPLLRWDRSFGEREGFEENLAREAETALQATQQCKEGLQDTARGQHPVAPQTGSSRRASLALVVSLSRPSSALSLRQEEPLQDRHQRKREVFFTHCMRWGMAVPLRLLEDETTAAHLAVPPPASHVEPLAVIPILSAPQQLRFAASASSQFHVFPVLDSELPEVSASNEAFAVSLSRQGPLLTVRISPSLETSIGAAQAAFSDETVLMEWTPPPRTEVFIQDRSLGRSRLLLRLEAAAAATRPVSFAERGDAEAPPEAKETAAPPLAAFIVVACLGALTFWLLCRSTATAGPSAFKTAADSTPQHPSTGKGVVKNQGVYRTRSGRAAATKYDAPAPLLMQSTGGIPAYTLQSNGDWRVEEPLVGSPCAVSSASAKTATRFYDT
ncbi:hypothetical protein cyc_08434 [Cyclospora cayetanensis]|uniref:Transmembrane protein n=1 Tax=Cyclospora cayetanensis TaxID=88456 RepID=A0A1D3D3K8_9EIME|nr:hypothetical protein cyc_08434 [Cyclospora cayetanensis]